MPNMQVWNEDKLLITLPEGGIGPFYVLKEGAKEPERTWRYRAVPDSEEDPTRTSTAGHGGFGSVIKALDPLGLMRAVKLYLEPADLRRRTPSAESAAEAILTNKRQFKHVVDAFDQGTSVDVDGKEFAYAVSQFIEGISFKKYRSLITSDDAAKTILANVGLRNRVHDNVLAIVTDIASALKEMHGADIAHMDVKPDNILIYPSSYSPTSLRQTAVPEAFLIDLGAGNDVSKLKEPRTRAVLTPDYFPLHLMDVLDYKHSEFSTAALQKYWRYIDLFSFGRTMENLFLDRHKRGTFQNVRQWREEHGIKQVDLHPDTPRQEREKVECWSKVFRDDFAVLEAIIDKLLREDPAQAYPDAAKVFEDLRALPRISDSGVLSSDSLTDRYPRIRIRTGHGLVRVSSPYDEIIDHPVFQRLRRIQQLSFVSDIFPDGTHNRFTHSLRTYHLAKQFVWGLNRKSAFRTLFKRSNVETLLVSALLHDVGQYHFSHCIEDLRKMGTAQKISQLAAIQHDQELVMTQLERAECGSSLKMILESHEIEVDDVTYVVQKGKNDAADARLLISREIISGVIDVDRVSYLAHDSERTGVPYGRAMDVGTLIEALTIRWNPRAGYAADAKAEDKIVALGIEDSGVSTVEAILAATYWMYRNVYWHHTNRAFMAAVKFAIRHIFMNTRFGFSDYLKGTYGGSDLDALRWIRRRFRKVAAAKGLRDPLESLWERRRIGYKRIYSLRHEAVSDPSLSALQSEVLQTAALANTDRMNKTLKDTLNERLREVVLNLAAEVAEGKWRHARLFGKIVNAASPDTEDALAEAIGSKLLSGIRVDIGDILVDIPLKGRFDSEPDPFFVEPPATISELGARKATVYVALRSKLTRQLERWVDIKEHSRLAAEIGRAEAYNGRKVRIFFSRELMGRLDDSLRRKVEAGMLDTLSEAMENLPKRAALAPV